jgi:hypothetical protein
MGNRIEVYTPAGKAYADDGDYIVNNRGDLFVYSSQTFNSIFEPSWANCSDGEVRGIICIHCGWAMPYRDDMQRAEAVEQMRKHDGECKMHPMSRRVEELEGALKKARDVLYEDALNRLRYMQMSEGGRLMAAKNTVSEYDAALAAKGVQS